MLPEPTHPEALAASACMHRGIALASRGQCSLARRWFSMAVGHYSAAVAEQPTDHHHWCLAGAWLQWSDCCIAESSTAEFSEPLRGLHLALRSLERIDLDADPGYRDRFILAQLRLAEISAKQENLPDCRRHLDAAEAELASPCHQNHPSRKLLRLAHRIESARLHLRLGDIAQALSDSSEAVMALEPDMPGSVKSSSWGMRSQVLATALESTTRVEEIPAILEELTQMTDHLLGCYDPSIVADWCGWVRFCATFHLHWSPGSLENLATRWTSRCRSLPATWRVPINTELDAICLLAIQQTELTAYSHTLDDEVMSSQTRLLASLMRARRQLQHPAA